MDFEKIERISSDYWRNSQLSIARHYGRCNIGGYVFVLDSLTDELVREDVYKNLLKERKKGKQAKKADSTACQLELSEWKGERNEIRN